MLEFLIPVVSASLDFGGDHPSVTQPDDRAHLLAFFEGSPVGQGEVVVNRNDLIDQTISVHSSLSLIDRVVFFGTYSGDDLMDYQGLSVDNLVLTTVPEPSALILLGISGLAAFARMAR